ncbi:transposase [Methylobacterium sp. OAE515]|uniref:IS66 family transposase zinc-finger binding domain-containing protein n=1 Tax=Methylobacterium sp. OAE515 TaxID=2817895 RepID=UPI001A0169E3
MVASQADEEIADSAKRVGRAARRTNRCALPAHLPPIERVIDLDDRTCSCCRGNLRVIGEDVSERFDTVPAQFRVVLTGRPNYACLACAAPPRTVLIARNPTGFGRPAVGGF